MQISSNLSHVRNCFHWIDCFHYIFETVKNSGQTHKTQLSDMYVGCNRRRNV